MKVTDLFRHPLKSHGREAVQEVELIAGQSMPWDRVWAIAHTAAQVQPGVWGPCVNFSRGSKTPELLAITCRFNPESELLTLSHPDLADITCHPDRNADSLLAWVGRLVPPEQAAPSQVMRLDGRAYTDSDFASVTLCNRATHEAVEAKIGQSLALHRWRGNIWFDATEAWIERDWIGRDVRVGEALLRIHENTDRCLATTANPDTGRRDADILGTLATWGHQDFGVRAEVIQGGRIEIGAQVKVA